MSRNAKCRIALAWRRGGVFDDIVIARDKGLLPGSGYEKGAALQRLFLPRIAEKFNRHHKGE